MLFPIEDQISEAESETGSEGEIQDDSDDVSLCDIPVANENEMDELNLDPFLLNDTSIVVDVNNTGNDDARFEVPAAVPVPFVPVSNDDPGEVRSLMALTNVDPVPSSSMHNVIPKLKDFVIVKYYISEGQSERHRFYIGQVQEGNESDLFRVRFMKKYLNRTNEIVFVEKMNNGKLEYDIDSVPLKNVVKILDGSKITRGRHIFDFEICALYF